MVLGRLGGESVCFFSPYTGLLAKIIRTVVLESGFQPETVERAKTGRVYASE